MYKEEVFVKIVNFFIPQIMKFVSISAKLLDLFLIPVYREKSHTYYVKIFYKKLNVYPLYIDQRYNVSSYKLGIRH